MIYQLFIFFILLGITFICLGMWSKAIVLEILGFMTIFLMGIVLMSGGIDHISGEHTTTQYTYTDYNSTNLLNSTTAINDYSYSSYTNHTIGFYLCVISALGFAYVWFSLKDREDD